MRRLATSTPSGLNVPGLSSPGPMVAWTAAILLISSLAVSGGPQPASQSAATSLHESSVTPATSVGELPVRFEANRGQAPADVEFLVRGATSTVLLTRDGLMLEMTDPSDPGLTAQVGLRHLGASTTGVSGEGRLPGATNYLLGDDPAGWVTGVPSYGQVAYTDLYPGIDFAVHAPDGRVRYDYHLAPGADPGAIRLQVEGATALSVDATGDLIIDTPLGAVSQTAPVVYQDIDGTRHPVEAAYLVDGDQVGFTVGDYDPTRPLVIDPTLGWATYLGLPGIAQDYTHATDGTGHTYLAGSTTDPSFPTTTGVVQAQKPGSVDVFVAKINPDGTAIEYLTYLGGSAGERHPDVAVDDSGNVVVGGLTASSDFPTFNGLSLPPSPDSLITDGFVSVLNADATDFLFSTYLGGSSDDSVVAVASSDGLIHAAGRTLSTDFSPILAPHQSANAGAEDGFLITYDLDFDIQYSTYFGGSGQDIIWDIEATSTGAVVATGQTGSIDFPVTGDTGLQTSHAGGSNDAFVIKVDHLGHLRFSTYLGGDGNDLGNGVGLDTSDNIYLVGTSRSTSFPGVETFDGLSYLVQLTADGSGFVYGLSVPALLADVAVDGADRAWTVGRVGSSFSGDLISPLQSKHGGGTTDGYIARVVPDGILDFATLWGGSGNEFPNSIAVDDNGNAYVSLGTSGSSDILDIYDSLTGDGPFFSDGFLLRIDVPLPDIGLTADLDVTLVPEGGQQFVGDTVGYVATISNSGPSATSAVLLVEREFPEQTTWGNLLPDAVTSDGTFVLDLGVLNVGADVEVPFEIVYGAFGLHDVTATVTSSVDDEDLSDNVDLLTQQVDLPLDTPGVETGGFTVDGTLTTDGFPLAMVGVRIPGLLIAGNPPGDLIIPADLTPKQVFGGDVFITGFGSFEIPKDVELFTPDVAVVSGDLSLPVENSGWKEGGVFITGFGTFLPGDVFIPQPLDWDPAARLLFADDTTDVLVAERSNETATLRITDDPVAGVGSFASGGTADTVLKFCAGVFSAEIGDGDGVIFTCGSFTATVVAGEVTLHLGDGTVLDVPAETTVVIDDRDDGGFDVTVTEGGPVTVTVGLFTFQLFEGEIAPDPAGDPDFDGAITALEMMVGTDPLDPDTDDDRILDGEDPDTLGLFVQSLGDDSFLVPDLRTAIAGVLADAEASILAGDLEKAVQTLKDLRRHVDGCDGTANESPDFDDWIVECLDQRVARAILDVLIVNLEDLLT